MKEIIVVKIKAVHASRKRRRRGCAAWRGLCGARGLCATYDIKRIAFAKTAEEWPSRPCSRTFMAFRDSVLLCTVGLAGPCTSYANTFFFCESATLHKCVFSKRPYLKKLNFSNFSCRFLNPNYFLQFEFELLYTHYVPQLCQLTIVLMHCRMFRDPSWLNQQ